MLQREVSEQIGVDTTSVFNWEGNRSTPEIRYMPAIIWFLAYNPLPAATTLAEQLVRPADQRGAFAEGGCRSDWRGPRHAGEVGTGEEGTGGAGTWSACSDSFETGRLWGRNARGRSVLPPERVRRQLAQPAATGHLRLCSLAVE